MRINELVWDGWNESHIARHGVRPGEVEDAVFDQRALVLRTRGTRSEARYVVLGVSGAGKHILVVLEPIVGGLAYVITARPMTRSERRRFEAGG